MTPLRLATSVSLVLATLVAPADAQFPVVDYIIQNFRFLPNASFSAGDAGGRKHTFEKGSLKMDTPIVMASSSKFPAAFAIAHVVHEGHLSFDTKVHDVFSWWTKSDQDPRSYVTLRHLLTFTSGLVSSDFSGGGMNCLIGDNATSYKPEACAKEIYEHAASQPGAYWTAPGTIWSYHSMHLQIAGAMAAKAVKMSVPAMLRKYLVEAVGMKNTQWFGAPNPHLAAAMVTTGDDYDKLLQTVLTYKVLPKAIVDEMEVDAYRTYKGLKPSQYPKDVGLGFYGHYSMCTYFECVGQPWSETCEKNGVHADPGAFGYWPLINREKGYYMNLVVFRPVSFNDTFMEKYHIPQDTLAALPGHCVSPLRFGIQSFVEKALHKGNVNDMGQLDELEAARKILSGSWPDNMAPPIDPLDWLCKVATDEVPPSINAEGNGESVAASSAELLDVIAV
mmetsp:Transcript_10197/g.22995  ORF Transcript_10197/g.22995 Transcript_10197/m.22995 type:complete len:448 (-) Transcript_10197:59-1402(-)|eukprot:CAMPEP_0178413076 /NCGR_PEP_ID=MMETSP0689_2-20121128/22343_1 /TAXON_ID=160604 /ORGANISM="Amphidinium massartii, Strain CS-259" /LENGTH=447 /DNA_ID=CAMNT_0020034341 /DNA_START=31 /DNA_END=1374 /DNA_ORIENTATION=+